MKRMLARWIVSVVIMLPVVMLLSPSICRAADAAPVALAPRVFSHPDRIRYDGQCFTIEGKDTFIFSGAFHYFRCPKELWQDRFNKIKLAGFNTVETYVAWNVHETQMPASVDDYSKIDLTDLEDFLTMAEQNGLYVILRPGPYICAEWDCGGFPQWLLPKKPQDYRGEWLRSDDPQFVAWSRHWLHAVDQVAVKHQLTHRAAGQKGIILYQLENEYDYAGFPKQVKENYVRALGEAAVADGIDVPLFTCWTSVVRGSNDPVLRQAFDTCNFYPSMNVNDVAERIVAQRKSEPDSPLMTTELQGGWFGNVGRAGSLAKDWTSYITRAPAVQEQNLTLFVMQNGDTAFNYYMLFGGTNFGDLAPEGITTSYDYSCPIREIGGVGEKYQRVAAIGRMLAEHGERLAHAEVVPCEVKTDQKDVTVVMRKSPDGSRYLFVRTSQSKAAREGTAHVTTKEGDKEDLAFAYKLEPFGSMILYLPPGKTAAEQGKWLPEAMPAIERPTSDLPEAITLTRALRMDDPGPSQWAPLAAGATLEESGIYHRGYIFYRAKAQIPEAEVGKGSEMVLTVNAPPGDAVIPSINGTIGPAIGRVGNDAVGKLLKPGENQVVLLYENVGQPNGGAGMEHMKGIRKIVLQTRADAARGSMNQWKMIRLKNGKNLAAHLKTLPEGAADENAAGEMVTINSMAADQLNEDESAVFRATVDVLPDVLEKGGMVLSVSRMDDEGWVFVNGKKAGEAHDWSQQSSYDVTKLLHAGSNSVAIVVRNAGGQGGLGIVRLTDPSQETAGLAMEYSADVAGVVGQWWKNELDDSSWTSQPIDSVKGKQPAARPATALLSWYRAKFELPQPKAGVWVPWVARLQLTGNGFLYLNGHPLGRYWNVGPQHDFFLPECWLNFGAGETNVLTMCLRPVEGDAVISSAQIVPVNELAEIRK